jgi:transcriptional regulator with XRE-family HTH domain
MSTFSLRDRREAMGLSLLEFARVAGCSAEIVMHAEFGMELPRDLALRDRLAQAYRMSRQSLDRTMIQAARVFRERTRCPELT